MRHFMVEPSTNSELPADDSFKSNLVLHYETRFHPLCVCSFWMYAMDRFDIRILVFKKKKIICWRFFMQLLLNPALHPPGRIFVYYEFFLCKILYSPGSCLISRWVEHLK